MQVGQMNVGLKSLMGGTAYYYGCWQVKYSCLQCISSLNPLRTGAILISEASWLMFS